MSLVCVCVCLCVWTTKWPSFDLDIWHAAQYLGQVESSRPQVKVHGYRSNNTANEVGATSSKGFLMLNDIGMVEWVSVCLWAVQCGGDRCTEVFDEFVVSRRCWRDRCEPRQSLPRYHSRHRSNFTHLILTTFQLATAEYTGDGYSATSNACYLRMFRLGPGLAASPPSSA